MAEAALGRLAAALGWTGRRTLSLGAYLLDLTIFTVKAMRDWGGHGRLFNRATLQTLISQIIFTGVDALPVVTLLALAVGLSITSQILSLAQALGSERDVAVLLTDGICEAQNERRVLFGFARVESMLREGASAGDVAEAAQQHGQNDDLTVLRVVRAA